MEELEYFLKEWIDSYVVTKDLTSDLAKRKLDQDAAVHEWKSKDKDMTIYFGNQRFSQHSVQRIVARRVNKHINFDLDVKRNEYKLLKDLDGIVNGYARLINYHDRGEYGHDYSFQLIANNEEHANNIMKRLFDL